MIRLRIDGLVYRILNNARCFGMFAESSMLISSENSRKLHVRNKQIKQTSCRRSSFELSTAYHPIRHGRTLFHERIDERILGKRQKMLANNSLRAQSKEGRSVD